MKKTKLLMLATAVAVLGTGAAFAKVPADQVARLGKDLTPMGSERAGSPDGMVPAWDGGLSAPPAGIKFDPKTQNVPNPFPNDKPKFTITGANAGQYDANLTDGHKALLKKFGSYKMNVYESRRTCALPQYAYEAIKYNAANAELTPDGDGIKNFKVGYPFPIPGNAMELMHNKRFSFRGYKTTRQFAAAPVQSNGSFNLISVQDEAIFRYANPAVKSSDELNNIGLLYIANTIAPARLAGNVILVHESINASVEPRKAWQYSPGTRRVRRAPDIAYDNPGTNTDAMSTSDAFDGFNGALDRYTWDLKPRQTKFIAYNSYDLLHTKYANLVKPQHINQDLVRYEPHRVHVVEAKLKAGSRHVYARRVFYMDEDAKVVNNAENYDGRGQLWRFQEIPLVNAYHVPHCGTGALELVYDLLSSRYLALSMRAEEPPVNYFADELNEARYTPEAIRTLGVR
ncbi:MAG: DUF1329 domain-containing protein [Alphaproteobacteria bacterium]|nr:DUF1329 domain-containing protein [Alphaproteobacteria bacterium]